MRHTSLNFLVRTSPNDAGGSEAMSVMIYTVDMADIKSVATVTAATTKSSNRGAASSIITDDQIKIETEHKKSNGSAAAAGASAVATRRMLRSVCELKGHTDRVW